jgi:GH24 family phage-related lysozyme (muramidase)
MKTISETGLSLIKRFEGCRLIAYDDLQPHVLLMANSKIKGTLTIGWGHTGGVYIGQTITQEEADSWLIRDLSRYIAYVNNLFYVPVVSKLNQNQFDALVSFCYNCGPENLRKLCTSRTLSEISAKIPEYNKAAGKELLGLSNRRKAEKLLFDTKPEAINVDNDQINTLKQLVLTLENKVKSLENLMKEIPAPQWILEEFPDVEENLNNHVATYDFWRSALFTLRIAKEILEKKA